EIAAADARMLGVEEGDTVRVSSRRASLLIPVRISNRQACGQVFIPMHFREAAANLLTNPALDPYAKIAEFKVAAVRVDRVYRVGCRVWGLHSPHPTPATLHPLSSRPL